MPRRNRPKTARSSATASAAASAKGSAQVRPLTSTSQRLESFRGIDYVVRSLAGSAAAGPYRCPGCDQQLAGSTPHVVVWPEHDGEASDRRHWHTSCWAGRASRAPVTERSRNAPRYS